MFVCVCSSCPFLQHSHCRPAQSRLGPIDDSYADVSPCLPFFRNRVSRVKPHTISDDYRLLLIMNHYELHSLQVWRL